MESHIIWYLYNTSRSAQKSLHIPRISVETFKNSQSVLSPNNDKRLKTGSFIRNFPRIDIREPKAYQVITVACDLSTFRLFMFENRRKFIVLINNTIVSLSSTIECCILCSVQFQYISVFISDWCFSNSGGFLISHVSFYICTENVLEENGTYAVKLKIWVKIIFFM